MKVKEESEKVDLKLNIQKTKIMASGPITAWEISIDGSPPGSSVPGILQARTLEWVAISFSWWVFNMFKKQRLSPLREMRVRKALTTGIDSSTCCSVTQSCTTFCDPMDCSTTGFPVHHKLLEFTQTHVHWVGDAIQCSHPLSSLTVSNLSPSICHEVMGPYSIILVFWMIFKPTFSLFYFTFIKRLFSSLFSAIRVVSPAYLRLLIFHPAILIPVCA